MYWQAVLNNAGRVLDVLVKQDYSAAYPASGGTPIIPAVLTWFFLIGVGVILVRWRSMTSTALLILLALPLMAAVAFRAPSEVIEAATVLPAICIIPALAIYTTGGMLGRLPIALDRINGRVAGVRTDTGDRISADAVVLTTELPETYRLLGRKPRRLLALRPAPSAVVAHVGCRASGSDIGHHTIVFGDAWEQTFRDIIDDGRLMGDPSLLVTRPTAGDPGLAPAGRDLLYVLAPAPNTVVGKLDWGAIGAAYTERILETVTRRLPQLGVDADVLHVVDPAGWARQGMSAGTPFALAHTFGQTGPFRPANTIRGIENVVLAGSSTVPGVGVPMALLSGRLAADRITGVVNRRRPSQVVQT